MNPFYAEELHNINTLRACISAKSGYDVAKELKVKNNTLILGDQIVADFSAISVKVTADSLIVAQPDIAVSEKNDVERSFVPWEIKLNLVKSTNPQQQQNDVREWWTAKELLQLNSNDNRKDIQNLHLQCRSCAHKLVDSQVAYTVKDLPSEHWYELVECWICHEAKAEEHKSRMQPILARANTLLVGTTYFLVHADNILQDAIAIDSMVAERLDWNRGTMTKWITLNCNNCKLTVGEGHYTKRNNEQPRLLAVKLFKYSTSPSAPPSLPSVQPSFMDFFVSDLVNTARVHATHRFLIQGRQSQTIYSLIWLFNWDTHIIHNNGFSNDQDSSYQLQLQRQRVIKLTYLDCVNDQNKLLGQKYTPLWLQDRSTDHLLYPDVFCIELVKQLKRSTLILPHFMRKIQHPALVFAQDFSVGFIPRASD